MTHEHEAPKGFIRVSAGDASTIMGANKYQTLYELWQIKTGQIPKPDLSQNKKVKRGKQLELPVILMVLEELGLINDFNPSMQQVWLESPAGDRVGYMDYQIDEKTFMEVKAVGYFQTSEWEAGVPEIYLWQVIHYFSLDPKLQLAYVGALIGGQELIIHKIERDEALIAALLKEEETFLGYCRDKVEPPMTMLEEIKGETTNMLPDVEVLTEKYLQVGKEISALEKEKDTIKKALQTFVGNGNTQTGTRFSVAFTWQGRASINEDLMKADGLDPDKYKTQGGFYKISAKEVKK